MGDIKAEWEKALNERDCGRLLELFDDYIEEIEDEETLRGELKRLGDVLVECDDPYDLAYEVAHVYSHLGETEKGIEIYKRIAKRKKDDPDEYAVALYYLADAYEHFGMPEKAIEVYEQLLKLEEEIGNERETALTLAHLAVSHDELGEVEKAVALMERARDIFERLGDEVNLLTSLIDLAHFHYELGHYDEAEALIREVLRNPRNDEIEVNARLVEAEIHAGRKNYRAAFTALRDALLKTNEKEELFSLVFDTLVDFLEDLLDEGAYGDVYENVGLLAEAFEDDTADFFRAIGELARWREGDEEAKKRFEELYSKVKNEELRLILDEWKRPKLTFGL
ncbi:tetratricopeptide repeat protein [Pyrococcus yayanosii]|uniref:Uncharacterized protein n=1 Tax=Pyrococcus yayanosii (strain CH1 / JCM 16557) TaxID=529709 RepID=F8AFG3_PYRYC|nr:tetratricopeptide repeat protein [Pyrococcus yayanosii]AEH23770.1 hypothetical protein PYCH_00570 [Pyrococcus yayanosii CH1]